MGTRRRAREAALQFLFQDDFLDRGRSTNAAELDERFDAFSLLYQVNKKARPYARKLIGGIFDKLDEIDGAIGAHATNYSVAPTDVRKQPARHHPLGTMHQVEVLVHAEARNILQDRPHHAAHRPWRDGGLDDDQGVGREMMRQAGQRAP